MPDTLLGLVRAFLEDFRYKPDTTFQIHPELYGIRIAASRKLPDSTHPDHPLIWVSGSISLGEHLMHAHDPTLVIQDMVHRWLIDMEVHEANEWFRVKGALPYDPHKERT